MGLHGTEHGGNWVLQQMGALYCRNGNARCSARTVVQVHNMLQARLQIWQTRVFWVWLAFWSMLEIYIGDKYGRDLACGGNRCMSIGAGSV